MAVASGAAFSVRPAPAARPCAAVSAAAGAARFRADGSSGGGGGAKWWAPLLGWSGQPDYIDAQPAASTTAEEMPAAMAQRGGGGRRFGVLTEEKARELRARMMETESFHDCMYHSAIASRLASASLADDGKH